MCIVCGRYNSIFQLGNMGNWNCHNKKHKNQTIITNKDVRKMLEKENQHKGCPNRGHCQKEESKCCYLLNNNTCYLDYEKSEDLNSC